LFFTARSELRKVLFLALSVTFSFFVCESNISATAEQICAKFTAKTCWFLAGTSLNVKVKGQGHQGQKHAVHSHHPPRQRRNGPFCCTTHCNTLAANNVTQQQTGPFRRCRGGGPVAAGELISAACVRFMLGKTS